MGPPGLRGRADSFENPKVWIMKTKFIRYFLNLVVIGLLVSLSGATLMGCTEETGKNPTGEISGKVDDGEPEEDVEDEEEEQEDLYTKGPLDGVWELSWVQSEEVFSIFTIVHNLDEERLAATFQSFDGEDDTQTGEVGVINWRNDKFSAEWKPFPASNPSENYRIPPAAFVEGSDDQIKGAVGGVTFDRREFVMVKKER